MGVCVVGAGVEVKSIPFCQYGLPNRCVQWHCKPPHSHTPPMLSRMCLGKLNVTFLMLLQQYNALYSKYTKAGKQRRH